MITHAPVRRRSADQRCASGIEGKDGERVDPAVGRRASRTQPSEPVARRRPAPLGEWVRSRTRVPGFEPGTFGFVDRCDGDARSDVSADKHDNNSDQEKYTTGAARTSLHTMGDMDPLLAQLVRQWDTLPGPVRNAIAALLECDQ
ncbi:MAG: hypothetical protein P8M22_08975 [Phycisphaerales bacterium]|nr:hypothetical protein [Phycisphaerales bacterium]